MKARLTFGWLVVLSLVAAIGYAQAPPAQQPTRTLALQEALDLARRNNPGYLIEANDTRAAGWARRSAIAQLITPDVTLEAGLFKSGERVIAGENRTVPALTEQSYGLRLNYQLSGATITQGGRAAAELRAAEQGTIFARTLLENQVRTDYLDALQSQAQQDIARRSLERATENLALASARNAVGQGTLIDVRRAEVAKGRAEVALLTADQAVLSEQLRLFQTIGVAHPEGPVQLTDSFPVTAPTWTLQEMTALALQDNPDLRAMRALQNSASWFVRSQRSLYLPSAFLSAGFNAQRLTQPATTPWERNPWTINIGVQLPLYEQFVRDASISQARGMEEDAVYRVRARELQVRTDVATALYAIEQAHRTIDIQRRNREASAEALDLATQRYRVGSGNYIELLDARVEAEQAEADYITAVYTYHRSIATLENAVGRPLR